MVLLKLETGPGWGQFKTNYLRREITREVRRRRPQWIVGSAECHRTEPASASFALSANWKSYPESDWHWATPVAFCADPGHAHLCAMRVISAGDAVFWSAGTGRVSWNPLCRTEDSVILTVERVFVSVTVEMPPTYWLAASISAWDAVGVGTTLESTLERRCAGSLTFLILSL